MNAVPVIAEGGSFGGYTSVLCAMLFPNDFHGGFSTASPASVRRYASEQESWEHQMALCGFIHSGKDFNRIDTMHYSRLLWQYWELNQASNPTAWANWSPHFHTSVSRLYRNGTLPRPVYFVINDEDSVSTGTDTLSLFDGQRTYHDHGQTADHMVSWSVAQKRCHEGGLHTTAAGTTNVDWVTDLFEFIHNVVTNFGTATASYPTPAAPDVSEDPYAALTIPPYSPATSQSPPLTLDSNFGATSMQNVPSGAKRTGKLWGSGTYLGGKDSLLIDSQEVFVGSAEGVVTRFALNASTGELVPQATSVALGYGAWALAVSQVESTRSVIVGTWRGMFRLNASTLAIVQSNTNLDFAQARPRRLKPFTFNGSWVVLAVSDMGALTLYNSNMQVVATWGEPAVIDVEVLSTTTDHVVLALLSERGHVIKVDWNPTSNAMSVLAVTERINGSPIDLEAGSWNGVPAVFALYGATPEDPALTSWPSTIRAFKVGDLSEISVPYTNVGNLLGFYGKEGDLELVKNSSGNVTHYVVLNGGVLRLVNAATPSTVTFQDLAKFAPMAWPRDVVLGDLGSSETHADFPDLDLVVSTQTGYVAWQTVDWLNGTGTPINPNSDRQAGTANAAPKWCNRTTAATWGLTREHGGSGLELIDQSGSRWHVDVNGNTTFKYQVMFAVAGNTTTATLQTGPFRDMFWGGSPTSIDQATLASIVAVADRTTQTGFQLPGTPSPKVIDIRTFPYVPEGGVRYLGYSGSTWTNNPGTGATHVLYSYDGYTMFPLGGQVVDLLGDQSSMQAHWWSGQEFWDASPAFKPWGNLVQGLYYDLTNSPPQINQWWASDYGPTATPGQTGVSHTAVNGHDLRSAVAGGFAMHDCQTLRLLRDPTDTSKVVVALGTPGGRVILLKPATSANGYDSFQVDSDDFGYGGMALATPPTAAAGRADIYFGVFSHFANNAYHSGSSTTPDDDHMVGALVALHWTGGSSFNASPQVKLLDNGLEKAYGVAGLAVGDVIPGNSMQELVVGTLDGKLLVYAINASTGDIGSLLYSTTLEGAVGAFNSIVIADLDNNGQNELYVAGSFGLRKFIYAPPD